MRYQMITRVAIDIILAFLIIQGWWFLALPLALTAVWFFPYYAEILIAGITYDSLFGLVPDLGLRAYFGLVFSVVGFLVVLAAKKVVRR